MKARRSPLQAATVLAACDVAVSVYGPAVGNRYRVPMKVAESLALAKPVVSNLVPGLLPLKPYLVRRPSPAAGALAGPWTGPWPAERLGPPSRPRLRAAAPGLGPAVAAAFLAQARLRPIPRCRAGNGNHDAAAAWPWRRWRP